VAGVFSLREVAIVAPLHGSLQNAYEEHLMRRWMCLLAMLIFGQGCDRPSQQASPAVKHVVIVSVDGLRPDMLLRVNAPVIKSLMRTGTYSMWARTTEVSITLPSHVSMLTGVTPERHAIWWNIEVDKEYMRYPAVPTIFQLAKQNGKTTALAVGKGKLEALGRPGSLDWAYWPDGYAQAVQVARESKKIRGASAGFAVHSFSGCGCGRAWERMGVAAAGAGD
jgi:hypothetical protein